MAFENVILGKTGLSVCPLGIASSYGTDTTMLEAAAEHGVNYLYWGALRTKKMAKGVKKIVRGKRDKFVIAAQTGEQLGYGLPSFVFKSIKKLGIDYLDVLLLGWHNKRPRQRLLDSAYILKEQGIVKFIGITGHNRLLFPELARSGEFDLFHVRYNAAHRGAEKEIFEHLPPEGGPGIVTFTNTRWGGLLRQGNMPPGKKPPRPCDCYRFTLSHPRVHLSVCGPNSMEQLLEDLKALEEGPMKAQEIEEMQFIGDYVYKNVSGLKDQLKGMATIKW